MRSAHHPHPHRHIYDDLWGDYGGGGGAHAFRCPL